MRLIFIILIISFSYSCKPSCGTCPAGAKVSKGQRKIVRQARKQERQLTKEQM